MLSFRFLLLSFAFFRFLLFISLPFNLYLPPTYHLSNRHRLAYPSLRPLGSWINNLLDRAGQLQNWTEEPTTIPNVTNVSYMFNPQSFLTAIMQVTAQKQRLELDKLTVLTDVTRKTAEQTEQRAREGAYVIGLYLEGARWNWQTGVLEVPSFTVHRSPFASTH